MLATLAVPVAIAHVLWVAALRDLSVPYGELATIAVVGIFQTLFGWLGDVALGVAVIIIVTF